MPIQIAVPTQCDPLATKIIEACENNWETHKGNCSGFVQAVAAQLGITLGIINADTIVDFIQTMAGWYEVKSAAEANLWAQAGYLVIAGLKGADQNKPNAHGHVVVVVPGPVNQRYPLAYWGQFNGTGKKNTSLNYAWVPEDRDRLLYRAARPQIAI